MLSFIILKNEGKKNTHGHSWNFEILLDDTYKVYYAREESGKSRKNFSFLSSVARLVLGHSIAAAL